MVDAESIKAYLLERFGIRTEEELIRAIRKTGRLNIGVFTTRKDDADEVDHK